MSLRKDSSKQRIRITRSIPRSIKRSSYRGSIFAAHSRTTNRSSCNSVNASWDHFDASCCNQHAKEHTILNRGPDRGKERLLKKSPRSVDENPFSTMPKRGKKNMLLEYDLELKVLLQQLHESTEFVGTINPLYHSHYLSPNKDHTTTA
jgi:hypothetical protein